MSVSRAPLKVPGLLILGLLSAVDCHAASIALFARAEALSGGAAVASGPVRRLPEPLFNQDKPWETRLDNGYPMVHRNARDGSYALWYGDCISSPSPGAPDCDKQVVLFANSTDGISWHKPILGLFDLSKPSWIRPELRQFGKDNNIVMAGGGVGVVRDESVAVGQSGAFKAFGTGCFEPGGGDETEDRQQGRGLRRRSTGESACVSGTGESVDGLTWTGAHSIDWPKPQRYDCENNILRMPNGSWVFTTRSYDPEGRGNGRSIAIATAPDWGEGPGPITTVEVGNEHFQLYSQVTFPWLDVWIGIVMVFDADNASTEGHVHCRLAASRDLKTGWHWVDPGGLTGKEFIPAGPPGSFDSHVCFAAATPIVEEDGHVRLYYIGGNGPHSGYRNSSFAMATLRPDGYAGVQLPSGSSFSAPVLVEAPQLLLTADLVHSLTITVAGSSLRGSIGPCNCTDAPVTWENGETLKQFTGKTVNLAFTASQHTPHREQEQSNAPSLVFAIGFHPETS